MTEANNNNGYLDPNVNYMIQQQQLNMMQRNTSTSSSTQNSTNVFNYNNNDMMMMINNPNYSQLLLLQQQQHQQQQQLQQLHHQQQQQQQGLIPFNLPVRIHSFTASTTLLRPRKPGDLLPPDYVPTNLDVCSGRGKRNWTHSGNVAFRDLIQHTTPGYMATATKNEKTAIVCNIVEDMRTLGCQFLKQDNKTNRWFDMGDAQARDKVGHSLRDQVSAYNRTLITGAPLDMEPLTLDSIVEYNTRSSSTDVIDVGQKHIRRPSLTLSDSGNEAEERRMSLDTTSIHGSFARRPSWVASSLKSSYTDDALMSVFHSDADTSTEPQQTPDESDDVVGEIPKMVPHIPAKNSLRGKDRSRSSWEFLDTFDFYIENDIDIVFGGNNAASRSISQTSDATPLIPIVSDEYVADRYHAPNPDNVATPDVTTSNNNIHNIDIVVAPRPEIQQSITMSEISDWNLKISKGNMDRMLHDSVKSWDPRLSNNTSTSFGIVPVRRSVMAGGTTLRRLTNSLKMSGKSYEDMLSSDEFRESLGPLNSFLDLEDDTMAHIAG